MNDASKHSDDLSQPFRELISAAARMTADLGVELSSMLEEGARTPLDATQAERLLSRIIEGIAKSRGTRASESGTPTSALLAIAMSARERVRALLGPKAARMATQKTVHLLP
jgi:hypothetical protein